MSRICILITAFLLTSCATPKYNYTPITRAISEPPIGSVTTARVGDAMLRQGKYTEHDAILLSSPVEISWAYTLRAGYYLKEGEDADAEYFMPGRGDGGGRIDKAGLADPWKAVMTKKVTRCWRSLKTDPPRSFKTDPRMKAT